MVVVALLGGASIGFYVTALVCVVASPGGNQLHTRAFVPDLWNDSDWKESASFETHYHSIRQQMVDDLIANQLRAGMRKEDVLGLIGPGDTDPYFGAPTADRWVYYLGVERGLGVDNEWLIVSFANGAVESASLATD